MRRHILVLATIVFFPHSSAAQDTPRFGIVMGVPAEVGILWNVTDSVAIRPDLTWTKSSTESTTTTFELGIPGLPPVSSTTSAETSQVGVGVSALFYLSKAEALRTYVSPRIGYSRVRTTLASDRPSILFNGNPSSTTALTSLAAAGSIGAQYSPVKRFAVFGEVGISYSHTGDRSPSFSVMFLDSNTDGWAVGLRTGIGVVLFFGS